MYNYVLYIICNLLIIYILILGINNSFRKNFSKNISVSIHFFKTSLIIFEYSDFSPEIAFSYNNIT